MRGLWIFKEIASTKNGSRLAECKELAYATADPAAGWSKVLDKGWMKIDKLSLPGRSFGSSPDGPALGE